MHISTFLYSEMFNEHYSLVLAFKKNTFLFCACSNFNRWRQHRNGEQEKSENSFPIPQRNPDYCHLLVWWCCVQLQRSLSCDFLTFLMRLFSSAKFYIGGFVANYLNNWKLIILSLAGMLYMIVIKVVYCKINGIRLEVLLFYRKYEPGDRWWEFFVDKRIRDSIS